MVEEEGKEAQYLTADLNDTKALNPSHFRGSLIGERTITTDEKDDSQRDPFSGNNTSAKTKKAKVKGALFWSETINNQSNSDYTFISYLFIITF